MSAKRLATSRDKMLQAENLMFERNGCTIFRGVNFHLDEGELLLLQGINGCGKSSESGDQFHMNSVSSATGNSTELGSFL